MNVKSSDELGHIFEEIGIVADNRACLKFGEYLILLGKWNSRINLTASSNWQRIRPLLQEGVWASRFYPQDAVLHLDIGSGAGFPIVPIQILVPRIRLDLVESRIKRAVFLEAVANKLGFSGAHVHAMRLDQYLKKCDRTWDCVSWKGLKLSDADLRELHAHSHAGTQLWMFHGKGLALKKPEMIEREFKLLRREQFPIHKGWILSIYAPI